MADHIKVFTTFQNDILGLDTSRAAFQRLWKNWSPGLRILKQEAIHTVNVDGLMQHLPIGPQAVVEGIFNHCVYVRYCKDTSDGTKLGSGGDGDPGEYAMSPEDEKDSDQQNEESGGKEGNNTEEANTSKPRVPFQKKGRWQHSGEGTSSSPTRSRASSNRCGTLHTTRPGS